MGGPLVDGFRIGEGKWDAPGSWSNVVFWVDLPSIAKDPRTDDVYYAGDFTVAKWSPKTGTSVLVGGRVGYSDTHMEAWNYMPSVVDVKRNTLVGLVVCNGYNVERIKGPCIQRMNIETRMPTAVPVSGDLNKLVSGTAIVHDLDGDRYLYFSGKAIYQINPDTGASKFLTTTLPVTFSLENRASYVQTLGGVVYLPAFDTNVQFLPTR